MNGDRTNWIIDAYLVQRHNGEHHDHAANGANDSGQQRRRGQWLGSNRNQACQRAVKRHGQVGLAEHQSCGHHRCHHTTGCRHIGVNENQRSSIGFTDIGYLQLRTTVETKPAQPKDERTQCCQWHVTARDRGNRPIFVVFALTRTEQDNTGQRRCRTTQMHHTRTRKILKTSRIKKTAAPLPVTLHWVDETRHHNGKAQKGPQFHPLGNGTRHDRHRGCNKHNLEEEV